MKTFASVAWTAGDVQSLAPRMTEEQAEKWLKENAKHIRDRLTELGWSVMEDLMRIDGIDMTEPEAGAA